MQEGVFIIEMYQIIILSCILTKYFNYFPISPSNLYSFRVSDFLKIYLLCYLFSVVFYAKSKFYFKCAIGAIIFFSNLISLHFWSFRQILLINELVLVYWTTELWRYWSKILTCIVFTGNSCIYNLWNNICILHLHAHKKYHEIFMKIQKKVPQK